VKTPHDDAKIKKLGRQSRIVAELRANPAVRISELARGFRASTETVRRDIAELSQKGLVSRTYGGATARAVLDSCPAAAPAAERSTLACAFWRGRQRLWYTTATR